MVPKYASYVRGHAPPPGASASGDLSERPGIPVPITEGRARVHRNPPVSAGHGPRHHGQARL
jgi:hypothetical protein